MLSVPAVAEDAKPVPFDFAFGARATSNYVFRGISQTANWGPSPQAYGEFQFFDNFLYAGVAYERTDLPTTAPAEIDFTAGIRPKAGKFTFDLGVIGYYYPSERRLVDLVSPLAPIIWTPKNADFTETKFSLSYALSDAWTLGGGWYHAWDWLGTGSTGDYFNFTAKYTLPEGLFGSGWAISGEVGHYALGRVSPGLGGFLLVDYNTWNVGLSYTWKNYTFDVRYYDTDLSKKSCFVDTTDPKGVLLFTATGGAVQRSSWCGATFVGTLSADFTLTGLGVLPK